MEEFRAIGIKEPILKSLEEHKFEKPSDIQRKTIPLVLEGRDVIAGSATGSGKTLAFGVGILQNLEKGKGIQALILTPTRELAEQNSRALRAFSKYSPLKIIPVYGGVSMGNQIDELKDAEVVIATPGRILDHLKRKTLSLSRVKILVLDEADRMLDMGFIDDVQDIILRCPKERQTLLFSATISSDIYEIARRYMKTPSHVSTEEMVDPSKLFQVYYDVPDHLKFSLLVHLLKNEEHGLVMVFCNTQRNTNFVSQNLRLNKIDALPIHGGLSQEKRNKTLREFHSKNFGVLVCTDVASRGLDIKNVSHIYNYDSPSESKAYIHRIGRTARAGEKGKAISLVAGRDYENFSNVMTDNDIKIPAVKMPYIERAEIRVFRDSGRGRGNYGRNQSSYGRSHESRYEPRHSSGAGRGFRPGYHSGNSRDSRYHSSHPRTSR